MLCCGACQNANLAFAVQPRTVHAVLQTDDEEALKDEGEEALRLQRQAAEALQAEDFEQVSEPDTSDNEEEDDRIETLGKMAASGVSTQQTGRRLDGNHLLGQLQCPLL